jgi:hypothetical protein
VNDSSPERPNPLRRSRLPLLVLALGVVGAAAYFFLGRERLAPSTDAPGTPTAAAPAEQAPPDAVPPALDPASVPSMIESLSADGTFRRWLADGDVARRWAVVIDNLAEGVSPRRPLALFAPSRPFSVVSEAGKLVIAPESASRYDRFAEAIASVDANTAATVYRALRGNLAAAYRALGYPDRSFDRITAKALDRLERAPVRNERIEVRDERGVYVFAEPALERLGQVEKHLLRMGPRNTRLIQAKAREIREALGFAAEEVADTNRQPGR